ncbi:MAG: Helicase associated domain protein [Clostridia bacterium]|nr:Helicase associated domain protein [Clostridia bacterium]
MKISLFEHNQRAYESAMSMLQEAGKAAVVHPTGTGKSFIGFKLCEEHPAQVICWLSPSEYIFKTQLENLSKASQGYTPKNIVFFTYAKLMLMSNEELDAIKPDYIILDEFHRVGAEMWGRGVGSLLKKYPQAPLLGLSATAIRYLDNRRNMAEELFDGCVASEMTLGEAIVRGILTPPKYVLSLFSYQKELEKYEQRVQRAKNRLVKDTAKVYLEALRRALDKADDLDVIFQKHITEKNGKYLVFCANYEHLCEMSKKAPEWFAGIDTQPHIYKAYSDDPETSRAFEEFKADDSPHLKLLFCIDMLNEGVHVSGISGVILLRPTVSPIIFKQQIGRALDVAKDSSAVIFDIVLNIENLYSIDAIEEEMQIAAAYYRCLGISEEIVHEHFKIIDEVRDCAELFDKLNDTLTASWDLMYKAAKEYYLENGDLEVPKRYVSAQGYTLGSWIAIQRLVYGGKVNGILTTEQIKKLEAIGMRWENARDLSWERYFSAAKSYYSEHGDLLVPATLQYRGVNLGAWIAKLRTCRKSGIKCAHLTPAHMQALDEIGMVWSAVDFLWERNYQAAVNYQKKHGNLDVPSDYVDEEGIRLGAWISSIRDAKKNVHSKRAQLTAEQIRKLDDLGMIWGSRQELLWNKNYMAVRAYYQQHGTLDIPVAYETEDGLRIGKWIRRRREEYLKGLLDAERKAKLDLLGMVWVQPDPWMQKFTLVERFYREHGSTKIPSDLVVEGVWLARWLSEQKCRLDGKSKKSLTADQTEKLASLGIYPHNKSLLSVNEPTVS